jgi:predicted ATP-binding protein involved in virulence
MPQRTGFTGDEGRASVFLDDDTALRDPEDWLLTADYNARLRGSDVRRFDAFAKRVRNVLVELLPEVAEIRIQAAEEPAGSPRVEARTPDGWVPLRQLGFGYQSQIAWLVDLASRMFERYPDSADPLAEPAVVLVDEIDLHMHPRWQRQIIDFLARRFPRAQFIVTAHSPLIVQAAGDANIVLLRREGDHVVIDNDPEVLRNWRVDQILTSELFGLESARPPQIEEPLKERREILAKAKLTKADERRLAELEQAIGDLPAGESAEDRRAMELIRQAAAKLSANR